MSSPVTEAESDLKNANVSSHQIPPTVEESNSEELIGMKNLEDCLLNIAASTQ